MGKLSDTWKIKQPIGVVYSEHEMISGPVPEHARATEAHLREYIQLVFEELAAKAQATGNRITMPDIEMAIHSAFQHPEYAGTECAKVVHYEQHGDAAFIIHNTLIPLRNLASHQTEGVETRYINIAELFDDYSAGLKALADPKLDKSTREDVLYPLTQPAPPKPTVRDRMEQDRLWDNLLRRR